MTLQIVHAESKAQLHGLGSFVRIIENAYSNIGKITSNQLAVCRSSLKISWMNGIRFNKLYDMAPRIHEFSKAL
jgi:hypothetical protein